MTSTTAPTRSVRLASKRGGLVHAWSDMLPQTWCGRRLAGVAWHREGMEAQLTCISCAAALNSGTPKPYRISR